jgi:hypothetical protein
MAAAGAIIWGVSRWADDPVAFLSSVAIVGYSVAGLIWEGVSFSEYWAGFVAVAAVATMLRGRPYVAAVLVLVAFASRELAAWLIPVYALWWALTDAEKRELPALLIATLGPVALYATHGALSPVSRQAADSMQAWLQGGADTLLAAVRFSGDLVPGSGWLYPLAVVSAIAGGVLIRDRATKWMAVASVLLPVALLAAFSSGQWGYYWGPIGMPVVLALAPLVFARLLPAETTGA